MLKSLKFSFSFIKVWRNENQVEINVLFFKMAKKRANWNQSKGRWIEEILQKLEKTTLKFFEKIYLKAHFRKME